MYVLRGFKRSTGTFNGITYDKIRFCFTSFSSAPGSSGEMPLVIGGKLPSCKTAALSSVCDGISGLEGLVSLVDKPCEVLVDRFGTIVSLRFPDDD